MRYERSLKELVTRAASRLDQVHPDDMGDGLRARLWELIEGVQNLVERAKEDEIVQLR